MKSRLLSVLLLAGSAAVFAFPPAPYYTLYGMVRDETGQTLTVDGAQVLLLRDGKELSRTPVKAFVQTDRTYELAMRLDQSRPGTALYSQAAVSTQGAFSLAVLMGAQRYYPIEISGSLTSGKGGEFVKLDLTLGQDSDADGLPDAWEMWQLFMAGHLPDANGWPLDLIDKDGDFDGDGQKNFMEYLAGTYAGDATEFFKVEIKERTADAVRLEFFGITNKLYTVERSSDGLAWTPVAFRTGRSDAPEDKSFRATQIGVVAAWAAATPGTAKEFYRLTVR